MNYDEVRPHIQTGDLVAIRRRTGALAVGTRLVTRSPYTHTGVALWVGPVGDRRLLMAHINGGGASLVPVSQMTCYDFDVYASPVAREDVERAIWATIGVKIDYSVEDLARILAHLWLGVALPPQGENYICSALSAHLYLLAGWSPRNLPSIPWPGAIVGALESTPRVVFRL